MKIRGNTVGTTTPRPDWDQANPNRADYILNKPDVPVVTEDDNGKIIGVVGGKTQAVKLADSLSLSGSTVSVKVALAPEKNNFLPISSSAVHKALGDIEALLESI